jgi:lipooligosaccharide transport system permease protein
MTASAIDAPAKSGGLRGYLPRFSWRALRVWERDLVAWRKIYRTSLLLNFGEPLINLLALGFGLGAYVTRLDNVSFAAYIAPGLICSTCMMGVTFDSAFGGFERLHDNGVYDALVTGPIDIQDLVAGELLWQMTRSALYGCTFLVVIFALHLVSSWLALLVLPLMVISGVIFGASALVIACVAKLQDHLFYYFTLAITPMFMFSGIFFPISSLPPVARDVIWFTPLYHFVNLARALVLGQMQTPGLPVDLLWVLVAAAIAMPWPVRAMRRQLMD